MARVPNDILIPIDSTIGGKVKMLLCHESQFVEWIPYNMNRLHEVPKGKAAQKKWLTAGHLERLGRFANVYRDLLVAQYGEKVV